MRNTQLARDLANLRVLLVRDRIVGRGNGEQPLEQLTPLGVGGNLAELPGHEIVLGAPEQPVLVLGDLDHQQRLILGEAVLAPDELHHLVGLFVGEAMVGACDTAQDVRQRGEVPRARRFEPVQLSGDPTNRLRVALPAAARRRALDPVEE